MNDTTQTSPTMTPVRPVDAGQMVPWFDVWRNPIAQRCRRARLRPRHLLTYGVLGFTIIGFVFLVTYMVPVYQMGSEHKTAAKAAVVPMLVIQGIIMMGMGTMALATGIARERDRELLDYQRMTPMSPTTKIIGFLFGLPAREYFLFAMTLPLVGYAAWVAELSWWAFAKYYAVFFSAVWMYHLTGLTAGMVSSKPWQSAVVSLGMVIVLYLVLPQLSYVGLSFFEYLTVYPTFLELIADEIRPERFGANPSQLFRVAGDLPFYNFTVNPIVFSLILQVGMSVTLFTVVRRKWIDRGWHCFSKPFAVVFVLAVHVVMVGTLIPTLRDGDQLHRLMREFGSPLGPEVLAWLMGLFFVVSTATLLFVTFLITPGQHTARRGFRRAQKLGQARVSAVWDAAPALRWVCILLMIAMGAYASLIASARGNPMLFQGPLHWRWIAAPLVVVALTVFLFHGLAERFRARTMVLALFLMWVLPVMVGVIVSIASKDEMPVMYIGSLCPVVPGVLLLVNLTHETGVVQHGWDVGLERDVLPRVMPVFSLFCGITGVVALCVQAQRIQWMKRWRSAESRNTPVSGTIEADVQ